jgi:hypothetical protein
LSIGLSDRIGVPEASIAVLVAFYKQSTLYWLDLLLIKEETALSGWQTLPPARLTESKTEAFVCRF